jgi:D-alanyl-D-alanine carboxypeptidase
MPDQELPTSNADSHTAAASELLQNPHSSTVPVVPQLGVALGLLVFVFGVTYIGATNVLTQGNRAQDDARIDATPPSRAQEARSLGSAFDNVVLEAESAYVWDVQNQRALFSKNGDERLPLASITKLMTALLTYELLDPTDTVAITLPVLRTDGDSGFVDGEEFTMQNLSDLTLITSSNDGAAALSAQAGAAILTEEDSDAVFVKAMNIKAEDLGLTKTSFKNSTGLDISETEAGAYGSARDASRLMEYLITHITDAVALTRLDITTINNNEGAYHLAKNTNEYVNSIEGLIASKTGYTKLSGGNLVIAVNAGLNRPVVVTVLGSSYEGRFKDALELLKRAKLYVENELP